MGAARDKIDWRSAHPSAALIYSSAVSAAAQQPEPPHIKYIIKIYGFPEAIEMFAFSLGFNT
jgi:F0F1-type ATP synthase membrane subunit c/vacuolar-type H+-ATPase subunit K